MVKLSDILQIRCNTCNHEIRVRSDCLTHDTVPYERDMGEEIEHDFFSELSCENCNSQINIRIKVFEYPVGVHNYNNYECDGGEFVNPPETIVVP